MINGHGTFHAIRCRRYEKTWCHADFRVAIGLGECVADLALIQIQQEREVRSKGVNRAYAEKAAFSNCFNLFASNSCSRRFFVIAIARSIS